jgi:hypothetical protein
MQPNGCSVNGVPAPGWRFFFVMGLLIGDVERQRPGGRGKGGESKTPRGAWQRRSATKQRWCWREARSSDRPARPCGAGYRLQNVGPCPKTRESRRLVGAVGCDPPNGPDDKRGPMSGYLLCDCLRYIAGVGCPAISRLVARSAANTWGGSRARSGSRWRTLPVTWPEYSTRILRVQGRRW